MREASLAQHPHQYNSPTHPPLGIWLAYLVLLVLHDLAVGGLLREHFPSGALHYNFHCAEARTDSWCYVEILPLLKEEWYDWTHTHQWASSLWHPIRRRVRAEIRWRLVVWPIVLRSQALARSQTRALKWGSDEVEGMNVLCDANLEELCCASSLQWLLQTETKQHLCLCISKHIALLIWKTCV